MKLIVGLGNPGMEYVKTRHNAGFLLIDRLCEKLDLTLDKSKCKAIYGIYRHKGEKIIIAKPQTYMNLSGQAVISLMHFYDVATEDLIVVHDDLDLPLGKLRLRSQGSSGGQKGMGNIIDLLGTSKINRMRIGISNDKQIDTKDYVLGRFSSEDEKVLDEVLEKGADALIYAFDHDYDLVMSKFN
ncbi:MAG: aminoacyl-tRNA hydrolase [Erysipelotrichaceae bacterium]|jgi:PTH1 family peptidyl-tRNA hydrolase|nr:aminoacyl-tRNA hydrolase [Erysipelotrichaceae bacterium]MBQ1322821.1 aminoacyl-tRNA hydrolase [Erysipelotrichaceae bacterium]MBQ1741084.1 aminoacyl-tRNA hydrolase [Erysipelotrichaceae bacterium]MBQ1775878.1 aminoacyl-tRNA hydrolase [Erysipelotrichaceae bacterium]MBQ2077994.1 aminoacyl-tRNA hydrolase [Erysipelotrichaceae bacterium]